ncbi:hypothetical protein V3390_09250 [Luteimonas sp. FXH3W]|uniref:Uncharacterized protein n=1 Tax=Aquilutibacter rugosus TaxID=3115820 RepID=A0ABU7V0X2_9GAMM
MVGKTLALITGTVASGELVRQITVAQAADPVLFGIVSQPLFLAAVAGAAFGVWKLQGMDGDIEGKQIAFIAKSATFLATVLGFALFSAWMITAILDWKTEGTQIHSSLGWIALSGITGFLMRNLLAKIQSAAERVIDIIVDAIERTLGGGS